MSTHPNALLICQLTPDNLTRKTYRAILEEHKLEEEEEPDIIIKEERYHVFVAEREYDDNWQIHSPEGSIVLLNLVTYGYGESIEWDKLVAIKETLEEWAKGICERHRCSYKILVSANYW